MPDEEDELTQEGEKAIKSVAKGGGIVLVGLLFSKLMGYIYNIVVARYLGASGYGVISLATAIVSFVFVFCILGLNHGIRRYVPFYKGKGDEGKVKGTIFSGLKVIAVLTVLITVVFFLASDFLALKIFNEPLAATVFKIFAIGLPFYVLFAGFISVADAFKKMKYRVVSQYFLREGSKVLFVIAFIFFGYEILGVAYAYLLSYMLGFGAALYFLIKGIFPKLKDVVSKPNYRELISYSYPLLFVSVMSVVLSNTDQLMLGYFLDSSQVGIYRSAFLTASILTVTLMAMRKITLPVLSELLGKEEVREFTRTFKTTIKWTFTVTLPLSTILVIFSPQVLDLIFGSEYVAGATALSILAVTYFVKACLGLTSSLLKSLGKTKLILLATSASGLSNILLNFVLIPRYGMIGAAVAYLVSIVLLYILYMFWSYKHLETAPFKHSLIKPPIATAASAVPIYLFFRHVFTPIKTWMLPVAFLVFITVYALLFLVLGGLDREDILVLKAVERKTGLRIEWLRNLIKKFI